MNSKVTSIILAGGKSSRMEENKALLKINGIRIIEYVYNAVKPISDEIIISCNSNDYDFLSAKFVQDEIKNIGPISGIYSGLKSSTNEINIIVSCDTPLLTTSFFEYMIKKSTGFDVSNPIYNNINQPIIGVFKKSIIPQIENLLNSGVISPPKIIKTLKHQLINIESTQSFFHPEMFRSINTPYDFNLVNSLL